MYFFLMIKSNRNHVGLICQRNQHVQKISGLQEQAWGLGPEDSASVSLCVKMKEEMQ